MNMDESKYFEWCKSASEDEKNLRDHCADLSNLFDDMLFAEGSTSYDLIKCLSALSIKSEEWIEDKVTLPPPLEYFTLNWFTIKIEEVKKGYRACFNSKEQEICVSPGSTNDDVVLLHELIHLYEFVINELPLFYHDALYWALYQDLRKKIDGLDDAISRHAHLVNEQDLYHRGGLHDILFLLKSFDLDLRKGYRFGTVFAYEKLENFDFMKIKE